jgi:transcriptional repressor NrdR
MKCPYCASENIKVIDKRNNPDEGVVRRRRECTACQNRFTTYERIENINLSVSKKDGRTEPFDRQKLWRGISKALKSDKPSEQAIKDIVDNVQMELLSRRSNLVTSKDIGDLVLKNLKNVDSVAYMRFASVYKSFKNLNDFEKEIVSLKNK